MRGLRFYPDERNLCIEDVDVREPRGGEVLVRVVRTGLCGSDLHIVDGEFAHFVRTPVTLGHEVAVSLRPSVTMSGSSGSARASP